MLIDRKRREAPNAAIGATTANSPLVSRLDCRKRPQRKGGLKSASAGSFERLLSRKIAESPKFRRRKGEGFLRKQ